MSFGMLFTVNYANPRISASFIMWKWGSIIPMIFELISFWSQDPCCSWQTTAYSLHYCSWRPPIWHYIRWFISYSEPDKIVTYTILSFGVPSPQNLEEKQLPNISYVTSFWDQSCTLQHQNQSDSGREMWHNTQATKDLGTEFYI